MRSPEEHLAAVRRLLGPARTEEVAVREAAGRVLAADALAAADSPRFDNSQMDGYAVDAAALETLPAALPVGPTVPAGTDPAEVVPEGVAGRAVPVMTGSKLPAGTAAVVPVEKCEPDTFTAAEAAGEVHVSATTTGKFVRAAGSDLARGAVVAPAGRRVDAITLAALINASVARVRVRARARVLICTGGAEVVDDPNGAATIPDSNGPMLAELCRHHGLEPVGRVRTDDDPGRLGADLAAAIEKHRPDVVVTSGGISHGRFEVVRQLLEADGQDVWFGHVTQQPGGPQGIGRLGGVPVVCLPGNPVSTMVSFRLFVAPALGEAPAPETARLTEALDGLSDARVQFRRGYLGRGTDAGAGAAPGAEPGAAAGDASVVTATPLGGPGSHLISQAVGADCLIEVPSGAHLAAGDAVTVHRL